MGPELKASDSVQLNSAQLQVSMNPKGKINEMLPFKIIGVEGILCAKGCFGYVAGTACSKEPSAKVMLGAIVTQHPTDSVVHYSSSNDRQCLITHRDKYVYFLDHFTPTKAWTWTKDADDAPKLPGPLAAPVQDEQGGLRGSGSLAPAHHSATAATLPPNKKQKTSKSESESGLGWTAVNHKRTM
ncbi:hypothetical protein BDP27DRAFT_1332513 [Rhodocollybia butyracea]|uniref:Uncharacterized protein n=1 Tax=Rhodocollybia butyracea TaxID=206335 RepID=A0A9P5U3Y7_9AGAR|nr:hypothetical protein BDP27DRAFT_1332513 [Rhodocollybia butyracea]